MNRPTDKSSKPAKSAKSVPGGSADEASFRPPPRVMPSYVEKAISQAEVTTEPEPETAPAIPFVSDLVSLWSVQAVAACLLMSLGLAVSAVGLLFCLYLVSLGLLAAYIARWISLPIILIAIFSCSYVSACFLAIMEGTAGGRDKIEDWPTGLWREWFWSMPSTFGMLGAAVLLGAAFGRVISDQSWLSTLIVTFFVYPFFQFSAVETGSPLYPISVPVLKSFRRVWWAWLVFYVETGVGGGLFLLVVVVCFLRFPFTTVILFAPLVGAAIFLYARLLGRLAWCALKYGNLSSDGK